MFTWRTFPNQHVPMMQDCEDVGLRCSYPIFVLPPTPFGELGENSQVMWRREGPQDTIYLLSIRWMNGSYHSFVRLGLRRCSTATRSQRMMLL